MNTAEKHKTDYASPGYRELERLFERRRGDRIVSRLPSEEAEERAKRMMERVAHRSR